MRKYRTRTFYTDSQKALMWDRWKKGDSLQKIAQLFDRNHSSISGIFAETGGIRPLTRCRSQIALELGTTKYSHVRDILANKRDQMKPASTTDWTSPEHEHVRGSTYYQ